MIERSIWFFGPSAAGKCTLIRAIESDQAQPLRVQLQLGSAVELCTESLDGGMSRDRLAAAIVRHHRSGLAQLIKGRSRDIWDEFPQLDVPGQLARLLPNCQQELLFIWAHPAELSRRCRGRAPSRPKTPVTKVAPPTGRRTAKKCASANTTSRSTGSLHLDYPSCG